VQVEQTRTSSCCMHATLQSRLLLKNVQATASSHYSTVQSQPYTVTCSKAHSSEHSSCKLQYMSSSLNTGKYKQVAGKDELHIVRVVSAVERASHLINVCKGPAEVSSIHQHRLNRHRCELKLAHVVSLHLAHIQHVVDQC
jgi:hypothetical protein